MVQLLLLLLLLLQCTLYLFISLSKLLTSTSCSNPQTYPIRGFT
jgi:hypothetical protein